jgi:integrase
VEALRAACSRRAPTGLRNRALLAVLFRSGLRISEALALYPKDLDPAGRSVRVLHGKGDKARTAPLPPDAADAIDRWLECRKRLRLTGRHALFCTLKGEPLWDSYVRTLCKRLAAKAGVEKRVHPHGFPHGWALGQVESGTSLPVIQQLLGHSSLATTATYVSHIAPAKAVAEATPKRRTWRCSRSAARRLALRRLLAGARVVATPCVDSGRLESGHVGREIPCQTRPAGLDHVPQRASARSSGECRLIHQGRQSSRKGLP